ncbi:MAG: YfhO family protein [Legionellaceae bacterium]|nr:YfhO family protein [Legionellaceae bacterium]
MFYSYPSVMFSYIKVKFNKRYVLPFAVAVCCLILTPASDVNLYSAHAVHTSWAVIGWVVFCQIFSIKSRGMLFGFLILSLFEMVSYRMTIYKMADLFLIPFPKEYRDVRLSHYQPTRVDFASAAFFHFKPLDVYAIGSSYLDVDACPAPRQDLISVGVKRLFDVRLGKLVSTDNPRLFLDPQGDHVLAQALGCQVPKLRLVQDVLYSTSNKEAVLLVGTSDIYHVPVIMRHDVNDSSLFQDVPPDRGALNPVQDASPARVDYNITERYFSSNKFYVLVDNKTTKTGWLIYADAYNPNWEVTVDGVTQPIFPVNLAFKAVQVEPGAHDVRFVFVHNTLFFVLFWGMMMLLACVVLASIGWQAGLFGFNKQGPKHVF